MFALEVHREGYALLVGALEDQAARREAARCGQRLHHAWGAFTSSLQVLDVLAGELVDSVVVCAYR